MGLLRQAEQRAKTDQAAKAMEWQQQQQRQQKQKRPRQQQPQQFRLPLSLTSAPKFACPLEQKEKQKELNDIWMDPL